MGILAPIWIYLLEIVRVLAPHSGHFAALLVSQILVPTFAVNPEFFEEGGEGWSRFSDGWRRACSLLGQYGVGRL